MNINGGLAIATDSNGLPVIAFINNSALNLYECSASDCSSGTRYVIDEGAGTSEVAMTLTSNDTRLIAYGGGHDGVGATLFLAVVGAP